MRFQWADSALGLLLWQIIATICSAEYTLQTIRDVVGAGNYSFYKLKKAGSVRLMLTSLQGDADLYVSSEFMQPDYENYDAKAASCGIDIVDIAEDMLRPVGVSVYGHSSAETTHYKLEIIVYEDASFDGTSSNLNPQSSPKSSSEHSNNANVKQDEEESLFSTILVGIIKLILDILL